MSSYRKNIMVGITILVALIVLGWMVLKFGAAPASLFKEPRMPIQFIASEANGIDEGSVILYRGVSVGSVARVRRSPDGEHVLINAEVDQTPPLPGDVKGEIRSISLVGGSAAIDLVLTGKAPSGKLTKNQQLPAEYLGLNILPTQFTELATELTRTVKQLRESNVIGDLDETIKTTQVQVEKAGKVFDSVEQLIGDPKMQEDLRQSLANMRETTASADRVSHKLEAVADQAGQTVKDAQATITATHSHIDELAGQLTARLVQVSKILENFQSISGKIDQGKGTAGLLVNDPKLYAALVAMVQNLNLTVQDLQRLAEQWEQEGVTLKLGK